MKARRIFAASLVLWSPILLLAPVFQIPSAHAAFCFKQVTGFFTGKKVVREIPHLERLDAKVRIRNLPAGKIGVGLEDLHPVIGGKVWVATAPDLAWAKSTGRAFENAHVEDLPRGMVYNYVILEDGTPVVGIIQDLSEVGVRLFQLADGRPIKAAGELRIDPRGSYSFNASSPVRPTVAAQREAQQGVRGDMTGYWQSLFKKAGDWNEEPSLTRRRAPTESDILALCRDPIFKVAQKALCR